MVFSVKTHLVPTIFWSGFRFMMSFSCFLDRNFVTPNSSVLVVGELLCTGVQANTERDTQGTKRAKCAHVGDTNNMYLCWKWVMCLFLSVCVSKC